MNWLIAYLIGASSVALWLCVCPPLDKAANLLGDATMVVLWPLFYVVVIWQMCDSLGFWAKREDKTE